MNEIVEQVIIKADGITKYDKERSLIEDKANDKHHHYMQTIRYFATDSTFH